MIYFDGSLDDTGWGNKVRSLVSAFILSRLTHQPLSINYSLYEACFTIPPECFIFAKADLFTSSPFVLREPHLITEWLQHHQSKDILLGCGFSFVDHLASFYNLESDYIDDLVLASSILFSHPSKSLLKYIDSNFPSFDSIAVFQFRSFVDADNANLPYVANFLSSLPRFDSSLFNASSPLFLFLSDSPSIASDMSNNFFKGRKPFRQYVDSTFQHTGYRFSISKLSGFSLLLELWRRLLESILRLYFYSSAYTSFANNELFSVCTAYDPIYLAKFKVKTVALWYLISQSNVIFSSFTSFVSTSAVYSSADLYIYDLDSLQFQTINHSSLVKRSLS